MKIVELLLATGKVNLQTHSPAISIMPDPHGGGIIETPRGQIRARKIVYANNGYISGLLPEYEQNIIPCKGICCRITVPQGTSAPLINDSYINRTKDNTLSYLIPRPDGSIIVGGAAAKFKPFRKQWYNSIDDSVLIDAAQDYYTDYMQQTYHGWENSGAKVDQIWTGIMGYSYDSNPHVGAVPAKKDHFMLAGFNGHGMPVIWLAAKELAKMLAKGVEFEQTCLPRLFKTTQQRIDGARKRGEEDGDILGGGSFSATKQ
jgi:glycine/D-amino acid oxidase-like deaminating enzyme